jgi:hypothetical protein
VGAWTLELVVRRAASQRQAGSCDHEFDPIGAHDGHDPYAYLKDVLTRLPTQRTSDIDQLLPHQWMPS